MVFLEAEPRKIFFWALVFMQTTSGTSLIQTPEMRTPHFSGSMFCTCTNCISINDNNSLTSEKRTPPIPLSGQKMNKPNTSTMINGKREQ